MYFASRFKSNIFYGFLIQYLLIIGLVGYMYLKGGQVNRSDVVTILYLTLIYTSGDSVSHITVQGENIYSRTIIVSMA